jgi:hypothetical protein
MEEALQYLATAKVHELLVLCGIGDCSDEPIKHHILGISNFGEHPITAWKHSLLIHIIVCDTRLQREQAQQIHLIL